MDGRLTEEVEGIPDMEDHSKVCLLDGLESVIMWATMMATVAAFRAPRGMHLVLPAEA